MSFPRVKVLGWAFGEILTSAQMNQLDIDHSNTVNAPAGVVTEATSFSNFTIATGSRVKLGGAQTFTRTQPGPGIPDTAASWTYVLNPGAWEAQNNSAPILIWPIDPPDGCILSQIETWITGSGLDVGQPANLPQVFTYQIDTTSNATTTIDTTADFWTTLAAYKARHKITGSPGVIVDRSKYRYQVAIQSESGAGSNSGLRVSGVNCKFQIASSGMDPAAA